MCWRRGQSLIELLIAIAIGILIVTAGVAVITPMLTSNKSLTDSQAAGSLAKELFENVRVVGESQWNAVAGLLEGQYYSLAPGATSSFLIATGTEDVINGSSTYRRYFVKENVTRNRLSGGYIATSSGSELDFSTVRITATASSTSGVVRTITGYLTRFQNNVLVQTDWSGGPGISGAFTEPRSRFATSTLILYASTTGSLYLDLDNFVPGYPADNIDPTDPNHWAWNDVIGWLDFYGTGNNARVTSEQLLGYASSSAGDISLDCATSNIGNICGTSDYKVENDGSGNLSGWAWNDTYGWISFCGGYAGCAPASVNYRVVIDESASGTFKGYAWNDAIGWISFCGGSGFPWLGCFPGSPVDYRVETVWRPYVASGTLESAIFDTGAVGGGQINSILWHGLRATNTAVGFQIAVSDIENPSTWDFKGPNGTTDPNDLYLPFDAGYSVSDMGYDVRGRYVRYRIKLESDPTLRYTPRVEDVIINWSP